jgi:hypothetical protein
MVRWNSSCVDNTMSEISRRLYLYVSRYSWYAELTICTYLTVDTKLKLLKVVVYILITLLHLTIFRILEIWCISFHECRNYDMWAGDTLYIFTIVPWRIKLPPQSYFVYSAILVYIILFIKWDSFYIKDTNKHILLCILKCIIHREKIKKSS